MNKISLLFEGRHLRFRYTWDIIEAADKGLLPDKVMLNTHPQRWDDRLGHGFAPVKPCSAGCFQHPSEIGSAFHRINVSRGEELVWQNVKNVVKRIIIRRLRRLTQIE